MKVFRMLARREFWEHRGLWITPLVIAAVLVLVPLAVGHTHLQVDVQRDVGAGARPGNPGAGPGGPGGPGPATPGDAPRMGSPGDPNGLDGRGGGMGGMGGPGVLDGAGNPPEAATAPARAAPVAESAGNVRTRLFTSAIIGIAVPFYIAAGILLVIYLLDCLYSERRDRSILFWKSMPVSDTETVLSKFVVAMVLVPLGTFVIAALTSLLVCGVVALRYRTGMFDGYLPLWDTLGWWRAQGYMLYGMLVVVLWYAPYAAYLMLASAWARRAVYAWALVPPILIALLERMIFNTNYFGAIVARRFGDLLNLAFGANRQINLNITDSSAWFRNGGGGMRPLAPGMDARTLIESPQIWFGLLVAALFLWAAIAIRRHRDEA